MTKIFEALEQAKRERERKGAGEGKDAEAKQEPPVVPEPAEPGRAPLSAEERQARRREEIRLELEQEMRAVERAETVERPEPPPVAEGPAEATPVAEEEVVAAHEETQETLAAEEPIAPEPEPFRPEPPEEPRMSRYEMLETNEGAPEAASQETPYAGAAGTKPRVSRRPRGGQAPAQLRKILRGSGTERYALEGNLLSANRGENIQSIMVTSSRAMEGKSTAAITIACSLAETKNENCLLVDGNLYSPRLHEVFELNIAPGLTDFLLSNVPAEDAICGTTVDNLYVMPRGRDVPSLSDIFDEETFAAKLQALKKEFKYIVFDADSILSSSDACLMASYFDGVIVVIECEKTKWQVFQVANEKLRNVNGKVLGVILNKRRYYVPKFLYSKL